MSRRQLLDSMDAVELTEWTALYTHIELMPEAQADLRMGIAVANGLVPYMKRGAPPPKPSDFIPRFDGAPQKPKQSIETMKTIWKQVCKAANRPRKKQ